MNNIPIDRIDPDDSDKPAIIPLQYEMPYGAEAAAIARARLSRRRFLRKALFSVWGVAATASVAAALYMLYPHLSGQFGDILDVGNKTDFPATTPEMLKLNQAGVFYQVLAKTYIVHLDGETHFLLTGGSLANQLTDELIVRDTDGSYWLALYQRCVHLGTTVAFRDDCNRFKCPSHGTTYQCDGAYMAGPAPRSMDRFPLSFQGDHVLVDTGRIIGVPLPHDTPRLLPLPLSTCM